VPTGRAGLKQQEEKRIPSPNKEKGRALISGERRRDFTIPDSSKKA